MADLLQTPNSGAAGTEFQTIRALKRLGHQVDTMWADDFPHMIKHSNLHYLFELPVAYRRALKARLSAQTYDVVHVNQPHGYLAAKSIVHQRRSPVFIHRSHGFEMRAASDLTRWREKYELDRRPSRRKLASRIMNRALMRNYDGIARFADGHIVSAAQCQDFLHSQMRVPLQKIAVIPQAAADSFFVAEVQGMNARRLRKVLYIGQYTFSKAPMVLASVMNNLADQHDELDLTWLCSREHHQQVLGLLKGKGRERVRLLDWVSQDELLEIYDTHGIFLFPSFFEGFGKVFIEAMSRGLCVVAADNGGAHDVITHGVDGFLIPTGDVDEITHQCLRLIKTPTEAAAISQAAVKTARSYTWDRVARETTSFYERIIDSKTSGG